MHEQNRNTGNEFNKTNEIVQYWLNPIKFKYLKRMYRDAFVPFKIGN